ncbi:MAG: hypothetical protein ACJ8GN_30255 [Longimicrobiaceae bacterium]
MIAEQQQQTGTHRSVRPAPVPGRLAARGPGAAALEAARERANAGAGVRAQAALGEALNRTPAVQRQIALGGALAHRPVGAAGPVVQRAGWGWASAAAGAALGWKLGSWADSVVPYRLGSLVGAGVGGLVGLAAPSLVDWLSPRQESPAARRARSWRETVEPRLAKGGEGTRTAENLAAEGPTARSLYVGGTELGMWDLMSEEQRGEVRKRHPGVKGGQTPDLVLHPGSERERIADIFTANAPNERGAELAQAAETGNFADARERRALAGVYTAILANADAKMRKYGGGTEAVVNLTQVPWADPETIRRLLVEKYGGADRVPGTLVGTINDDQSPERSRTIRIWPPSGERAVPRHYDLLQQERKEEEKKLLDRSNELDEGALSLFD